MILSTGFAVYALGLRHGADPDHLAAIDNLTRNSAESQPALSRFTGTLFAGGHTIMVLGLAALAGYLGSRFAGHAGLITAIGTWISILVLLALAALNLRQLSLGRSERIAGAKTRLLPKALRDAQSPWVAIPVGLLFGFGFETSSQVAAYALAFGADAGAFGALAVGATFCAGMATTDTLDSLLVHRLVAARNGDLPQGMRVWLWSVTVFAVAVAAYEFLGALGWTSPVPDLSISLALVAALLAVFVWVFFAPRQTRPVE